MPNFIDEMESRIFAAQLSQQNKVERAKRKYEPER